MYFLWKLVLLAVFSYGSSSGSDPEIIEDLNKEEAKQTTFLSNTDIVIETKFQCQDKPSGYYADPRFDCKVFHFCHEDGTRTTIPCSSIEEHQICHFKDIAFNACEGTEIYLELPKHLQLNASKETTASAINGATEYKLPDVLPQPSASDTNHSTTPLSLVPERKTKSNSVTSTKESDSIFEVVNTVLREIRPENKFPESKEVLKFSPSTFSRGSRFQSSSIRRDDNPEALLIKTSTVKDSPYLIEVHHKTNGKLLSDHTPYSKKSKSLYFLPMVQKLTPAIYPRRKRRTVVEPLNVSRPYAVIYAKVPDETKVSNVKPIKKELNQRRDLIEVPFVAARVPADVPTVPITIETRRKKKSKSKKKSKNNAQVVVLQEVDPQEPGNEQPAEQQNVLYFAPGETPDVGSQTNGNIGNDRRSPQQNIEQPQNIDTVQNSNAGGPQNNFRPNFQTSLGQQLPNFPFQSTFLNNPDSPQYYFTSPELQQPRNFAPLNLQDQLFFQPQERNVQQHRPFSQPDVQSQAGRQTNRPQSEARQPQDNIRPMQNTRYQNYLPEQHPSQSLRHPDSNSHAIRQPVNVVPTVKNTENVPQNIRQTEVYSQPEFNRQTFRQPNGILQSHREPENIRPQTIQRPNNLLAQTYRNPENIRVQTIRQPENIQLQTLRVPENAPNQAIRNPENSQPQGVGQQGIIPSVRRPEGIHPQTIGQLQNIYLQNIPNFSLGQPADVFQQTLGRPQSEDQPTQNAANNQEEKVQSRDRQRRPDVPSSQGFPGFDSSFFQNFPNFGPISFNSPFAPPAPQSFDLLSPHAVRYQEQQNPSQYTNIEENTRGEIPQQVERPQNQVNPNLILSESPQGPVPQNLIRQQIPDTHQPAINQPTPNIIYLDQSNQNPNLIEGERIKPKRPKPTRENARPHILIAVPEVSRPPRNRGRTTVTTDSPTRPPTSQRDREQPSQSNRNHNPRRPQENNRLYNRLPQNPHHQHSTSYRRPTESPLPTSEGTYRYQPQNRPEVHVSEIPNEIRHRYPTTQSVPDFRLQESTQPQNNGQRDSAYNQRQPAPHRNRQHYHDNTNGQTQPQYSTYQYASTTPVPEYSSRQRHRRPDQSPNVEVYQQNVRQGNRESATSPGDDRSIYSYRSTPPSYERPRSRPSTSREQTTGRTPVTNRYFVTSTPRFRQSHETTKRPQYHSESRPSRPRSRPQAQIEKPPQEYVNAEALREEYPRSHRYSSNRQQNSNAPNDVNIISTVEDGNYRTTTSDTERRPGYRDSSRDRPLHESDVEHGFLPVTEKPLREYSYVTSAPARQYATRAPERQILYSSQAPEIEYSYNTPAPEREQRYRVRYPEDDNSYNTRAPEREYSRTTRAPSMEYSQPTRAPSMEYSRATRAPSMEYSRATRAPDVEYQRATRVPERDYPYAPRAPEKEYSYSTRAPEKEYRNPADERVRDNRYQNNDEVPTTRPVTTPRPTKKRKPPPPRPTFPPFPTFPPPPKRITAPPQPVTEPPKSETYKTTEHAIEYSTAIPESNRRQKPKVEVVTEISESNYRTENYLNTDAPEVTTRRRSRKRRPRPRRPKTTTPYSEDEDAIQVESVTQATTHKEISTRSTPSNYNRWRQQTPSQKKTTSTTPATSKSSTEAEDKSDEFGSRINLFGRPRTRKPAAFTQRQTTTPEPSKNYEGRRVTKAPTATRTRKPFVKKVRKKVSTTSEAPETTDPIARSDENDEGTAHLSPESNLQELESNTMLVTENMEDYQTTEAYNDTFDITTEISTVGYEEDLQTDSKDKSENFESTRSVSKKFQNRPRILKFGKPRLKATDSS